MDRPFVQVTQLLETPAPPAWIESSIRTWMAHGLVPVEFILAPNFSKDSHGQIRGFSVSFSGDTWVTYEMLGSTPQLGIVTVAVDIPEVPSSFADETPDHLQNLLETLNAVTPQNPDNPFDAWERDTIPWNAQLGGGTNFVQLIRTRNVETLNYDWMIQVRSSLDHAVNQLLEWATRCNMNVGELVDSEPYRVVLHASERNARRIAFQVAEAFELTIRHRTDYVACTQDPPPQLADTTSILQTNVLEWSPDSPGIIEFFVDAVQPRHIQTGVLLGGSPRQTIWYHGVDGPRSPSWHVKLFPTTLGFRKDVDFTQMDHTQLNPEERRIIGSRCTWEGLLDFNVRAVFRVYPPLNRNWLLSLQKTGWEPTWPSVGWEVILGKYACDDERKMFPHHYLQTLSTEDGKEGYVTVVYENQTILPTILANAPWIRAEIDTFQIQDLFVYEKDQIFLRVSKTLLELLTRLPPEKTMQFVPFASTSDSDSE